MIMCKLKLNLIKESIDSQLALLSKLCQKS